MSHPDDGTIESLLDGELDAAERARVETHVASCGACAARVAEARAFRMEADRLVEVLAVPPSSAAGRAPRGRRAVLRTLAWAASIVMAVAVGYWGRGAAPGQAVVLQEGERSGGGRDAAPPASPPATESIPTAQPAVIATAHAPRAEAKSADKPAAVEPTPAPATERAIQDARANEVRANAARTPEAPATAWRVISMEEGVRLLDGQIRLIDGLAPERVETGPGTAVSGADPALPLVRVIYASGTVILDQQRPASEVAARREADAAVAGAAAASAPTAWQERGGIRFVMTGSVSADSLRALGARVR